MPQKKKYVNCFTTMALGVEKKITQLLNYVRPLSPTTAGEMQERMLMDLTHQLQASIDPMQLTWLEKQDKPQPPNFDRVSTFVRNTIATKDSSSWATDPDCRHVHQPNLPPINSNISTTPLNLKVHVTRRSSTLDPEI